LEVTSEPLLGLEGRTVTASIGIALLDGDVDAAEAIRRADTAMYRAKQSGRDRYALEADGDGLPESRRVSLTRALREGEAHHEMTLAFQPVFDLAGEEIVAIEALARWTSPTCGEVSPVEFIPLAESSGMIVPLGAWALRESCETAVRLGELSGRRLELAVNVSGHQLAKAGFAQAVDQTLTHANFPAELLTLEVTEGALMQGDEVTARTLDELRSLGVRLTVDDFGAGSASLVGFRERPVDGIKIDRRFLNGLPEDAVSFAVVSAISSMGIALGATVTAKGVETEAQLVSLRAMGCERVQGFLLAEPMRPQDLVARLRA
jgi:EAL domain-containing protein (putative c-di-GMP-specific phosphodiesterase class I)